MYGSNVYGTFAYSNNPITDEVITPFIPDLLKYLPPIYQEILEIKAIQDTIAPEIGNAKYSVASTIDQMFIETATWGLALWEKELGIVTDISKPEHFRREIVKARLRGRGTVTKQLIINTAKAFSGGDVEVIEYPAESRFVVRFVGVLGIPPNLAGLIEEIDNIKPAHLQYEFEYTYTTWDMLKQLTWDDARNYTWNDIKSYKGGA
ncbi:YmfQ family protein [Solibacillus sp. FSL H8-0523]|uniref:YmfQ family protein n=1 Tax=Solibacillus sp. FSL H8-0523 TaxID=2954511 RepID=UPI0031019BE2